ncbi:UxaA family hydrolase, partial [Agrobacterium rhizogenes]
MARYIKLTETDNIIVAIEPIAPGEAVAEIAARERIPRGHKMALQAIASRMPIVKYGQIIGFSTQDIEPGQWVHEHNVTMQ